MKFLINLKTDRTEDNLDTFFFNIRSITSNFNSIKIMSIAGDWDYCILLDSDDCLFIIEMLYKLNCITRCESHFILEEREKKIDSH